jgi:hypothetical protein
MIGKKINQLATELSPVSTDLTIIGDPISGVSKKITLAQLGAIFSGAVSFYTDLASFPATGDINVIYCAKDTQKLYLWSGSAYTEVFPSQALLDTYQLRSEKGNANGYASLDSGGKVPISQLPSSIMEYKGTWNASTNTPTLANGTGDTGDVYICNVAGTVNFGAGAIAFAVGDYVIYSGSIWQRSSGAVGTVTSVALTVGGDAISVSGSPLTTSGTLALAFSGTTSQYIRGNGTLETFPSLTGFVPYTGATANVNLGTFDLTADVITGATGSYTSSGGGNTLEVTHSSGSGIALNITKGGNGEGLYINKTSGSGNAATIIGTLNATTLVKSGGTSAQFLKADGSVDSNTYVTIDTFETITASKNFALGLSLGSAGGTNQASVFQNTSSLFSGSAGVNVFGFNSANNIYFGKGSDNGGVLQWSNSTVRYYTLPNATGTIALTSDLTGGTVTSVGLSSATSGVTIGSTPITTSGTITLAIATASGSQQGLLSSTDWTTFNNKQNALTNPVTGSGTTNYLPKFTGASTIGNSLINDDGTTIQATRTAGDLEFGLTAGNTTTAGNPSIALYSNTGAGNLVPYGTIKVSPDAAGNTRAAKMVFGVRQSGGSLLDALTINSSGNLGLGVTPSAWSLGKALEVGNVGNGIWNYGVSNTNIVTNAIWNSGNKYASNGAATMYAQNNGNHEWLIAPSGTAGNAISFTQAMTLTASGRLLINTTSEGTRELDVNGNIRVRSGAIDLSNDFNNQVYSLSNAMYLKVNGTERLSIASTGAASFSSSVTAGSQLSILGSDGGGKQLFFTGGTTKYNFMIAAQQNVNNGLEITPSSAAGGSTFSTPALVVTGTGSVGIGTTSPGSKLSIVGLPTSSAGLSSGDIYVLAGVLMIV